jgi:hypothetical protein
MLHVTSRESARSHCHIKSSIEKEDSFHQQIGLIFKEEPSEVLHVVLKLGHFGK